jgi:hypothetical protein
VLLSEVRAVVGAAAVEAWMEEHSWNAPDTPQRIHRDGVPLFREGEGEEPFGRYEASQ